MIITYTFLCLIIRAYVIFTDVKNCTPPLINGQQFYLKKKKNVTIRITVRAAFF